MKLFQTIAVAFSMYSAVPTPQFEWNEKNMRYAMCAFPLVGVLIGGIMWLGSFLCSLLQLPQILIAFLLTFLPLLITGGIHLDGFCDTGDAIASHAAREKKLEIMKDPHVGSFAVMKLCLYLMATFALWGSLKEYAPSAVWLSFVLSRALSGFAIATFPMAKNTGLAHAFSSAANKKATAVFLGILAAVCVIGLCFCGVRGIVMAVCALAVFLFYKIWSGKVFGGITGDLAGWFLQMCELLMLLGLVLTEYVEALL